ncbi:MAG: type III pantothenate kinase, partial [Candidatus Calescibacterium sp.]|nr:type III pantothenate kinase [Candidatus Calescibacterium sp.]
MDIGNTHTVFGILTNTTNEDMKKSIENDLNELRFSTRNIETAEDIYSRLYPFLIGFNNLVHCGKFKLNSFVVSSVVPQINFVIDRFVEKYIDCDNVCWVEARND